MRDIFLFLFIMGSIPFMLRNPAVGIYFWVWIGLMNPHRATWGFAYSFQFAFVVAVVTIIALVMTREPREFKGGAATGVLIAFVLWMCFTTAFALEPTEAVAMLDRVVKILFVTFLALIALHKREHVTMLMLVIVVSVGFFGVKGGLFTLLTGGENLVWGPTETFIEDNNALALAIVMTIPLLAYFYIMATKRWMRVAIAISIVLCAVCVFGSYSRGGLVAITAMSVFLWWKSKAKVALGMLVVLIGFAFYSFMPAGWETRMMTMSTYEQDASAMGRISTWTMLYNLAVDRPFVGGGFEPYSTEVFRQYLPEYDKTHSAHSIYFQVLGEHGFVGLALFLAFWLLTWRISQRIIKQTKGNPEARWAYWLAKMIQVSLIGYFVGGMFLNLAYWDMPYYLMVALAVTWHVLRKSTAASTEQQASSVSVPARSPVASS